jgi:DNA-directed RNA polymerase subunit M/transcription elongation factor TFIIS
MQIINKTIQCPECGCIAFPDAIHCPRCGASYRGRNVKVETREIFKNISHLPTQGPDDIDKTMMKAYFQLICPHHGQIDIKTAAIVPVMKCPLCQGN